MKLFSAITFSIVFLCMNLVALGPIGTSVVSYDLALQSDNKIVVAGYAAVCNQSQFMIARYGTNGALDGSLNGTGYATTQFGGYSVANAIIIQPLDQKIVAAGYSDDFIGVVRYTTSGSLDTTFASGGRLSLDIGSSEIATSLRMQSSKILVGGGGIVNEISQFLMARLTLEGELDTTFGPESQGYVTTLIGDGANANCIGEQSNGNLILAGVAVVSGAGHFAVAQYSSSGILDTTFGTNGVVTTSIDSFAAGNACTVDSSNRIIVVGYSRTTNSKLAIARYTSIGELDQTFGIDGITTLEVPGVETTGYGVAIQNDGKIVVVGTAGEDIIVARFTTVGTLDTTFNTTGYVLTSFGVPSNAYSVAIQPSDQKIVVVGNIDVSALAIRYNTNGSLDTSFGNSGISTDPAGSAELVCGVNTVLNAYGYLYNQNFSVLLNSSTPTPIAFTNNAIVSNISHDTATNPEDITFVLDGTYLAQAVVSLTNTDPAVEFELQLNGSPIGGTSMPGSSDGTVVLQAQFTVQSNDILNVVETGLVNTTITGNASITIEKIA